jgi:ubiquitin-like protein Pup
MPQKSTAYRPTPNSPTSPADQPAATTTVDDIDALLDDIDECLEENALEVIRAYTQRGGQ